MSPEFRPPDPTPDDPMPDGALHAAGFGQRAIARCIDMVVLMLLVTGAFAGFTERDANDEVTFDVPWWWILLVLVGVLTFELVPVRLRGQTPGKILTRIRVVDARTGRDPSWRQSFIRWLIPMVVLLTLAPVVGTVVFPLLAVIYGTALLDRGGRSSLDKLAGTRVVQAR